MPKNQTRYVDGYVLVVPKNKVAAYRKMAQEGKQIWMKCGALDYKECMGDDLSPPSMGGMTALTFPQMAQAKKGETVWFSYITYKSRAHRDLVNKKVMKEMETVYDKKTEKEKKQALPFDMKRMAYGGFNVMVGS